MNSSRHARLAGVALTLALALTACGDDSDGGSEGGSELSGTLVGIGASSQTAAMQAWQAGFQDANPDVTVNYDPQGSGAGREQFIAGASDFAGSDAYLDEEEQPKANERCGGEAVNLPNYISPIAVIYNLEGVAELNLKPATIAGIFEGKITKWNAPEIQADNAGATLPDLAITPVHRSDDSGTTTNFTDYLSKAAGGAWTNEPDGEWPAGLKGEAAQGTSGVVAAVKAGNGAIGYADASQAGDLGTAAIGVGSGFVKVSPEAAAASVAASPKAEGRGQYDLAFDLERDTTDPSHYPLVLVSYHIACLSYDSAEKADLVKAFLTYASSTEGQQAAASAAGSAPISSEIATQVKAAVDQIKAAG